MAKLYHNLTASTGREVELLPAGSIVWRIGSISITNTSDSVVSTIGLRLYKDATGETFQIQAKSTIPIGVTLIVDDQALLSFDNSSSGYSLNITVGSSDTVDVFINT